MKPYVRFRKVPRHFNFWGLIHASNDNIVHQDNLLKEILKRLDDIDKKPSWAMRWCSLVQAKLWLETKNKKNNKTIP